MQSYKDKVVVITGGATGIGFAIAKALGGDGAKVVIGEPDQARLDEGLTGLKAAGVEAAGFAMDVTDDASIDGFLKFTLDTHGRVDVLVNNAGIAAQRKGMLDADIANVRRVFDVNFFGVWQCAAVFGRQMREQGDQAEIFNVSSENALLVAAKGMASYVAAKHAVFGLSEAMRVDLPEHIHVGTIMPGWVYTEMTKMVGPEKPMPADEYAAIVVKQMKAGEKYIVSHSYNRVHVDERYAALTKAFETYAPRYDGDERHDVAIQVKKMMGGG